MRIDLNRFALISLILNEKERQGRTIMVDFRISGAGSNRNPFQQVRYQQNGLFQLPVTWGQNTTSSGGAGYQPYQDRSKVDDQLRDRQKLRSQEQPEQLQQMRNRIFIREGEIEKLRKQLHGANDPLIKRALEQSVNTKNAGYSSLQSEYNQMFSGITSGFVGNEGKIDHIGSFVTIV